ncbi:hypothetical protein F2P81_005138 [Scophthalmus maximus]|uniref:Uncharacterized protein n=1 Tax=Scophthalmus maximus TaxID=52904 RepID=A0A6A4T2B9_SCOMX|nr:hypothetical protein F2P81_005138 [Scophthalmus maximus]
MSRPLLEALRRAARNFPPGHGEGGGEEEEEDEEGEEGEEHVQRPTGGKSRQRSDPGGAGPGPGVGPGVGAPVSVLRGAKLQNDPKLHLTPPEIRGDRRTSAPCLSVLRCAAPGGSRDAGTRCGGCVPGKELWRGEEERGIPELQTAAASETTDSCFPLIYLRQHEPLLLLLFLSRWIHMTRFSTAACGGELSDASCPGWKNKRAGRSPADVELQFHHEDETLRANHSLTDPSADTQTQKQLICERLPPEAKVKPADSPEQTLQLDQATSGDAQQQGSSVAPSATRGGVDATRSTCRHHTRTMTDTRSDNDDADDIWTCVF